jgi:hypothetical protein
MPPLRRASLLAILLLPRLLVVIVLLLVCHGEIGCRSRHRRGARKASDV